MNQQGFEFGLSNLGGILLAIAGGLLLIFLFTSTAESAEGKIRGHGFTNFICQFKLFQTFVSACKPYLEIQERTHDLGQSLQQCFKDQKADCPDALKALFQVVVQQGKTLEVKNNEEAETSEILATDQENKQITLSFNHLTATCDAKPDPVKYLQEIHIRKGEQRTMEIAFMTGDVFFADLYHPIAGVGYRASKPPSLCIYHKYDPGDWW